jgi:hypothetical protein
MEKVEINEEELWEKIFSNIKEFENQNQTFLEVYGDLEEDADSIIAHEDFDSIRSQITKQNYKDFFSKRLNLYEKEVEILSLYDLYIEYFSGCSRIGKGELEVFISGLREKKEKLKNNLISILNGQ